jgi:beta-N-acetylhexosaminidase
LPSAISRQVTDAEPRAAIVGIAEAVLRSEEAELFQACPPAGVILFARNIKDPVQLAEVMAALRAVLPADADLMVDQEGGRVARLRPPHWRSHPPAAVIGALYERDAAAGLRLAWLTGALIGEDCRCAGFTVVAAPVLDLAVPGASDAIGDRALGQLSDTVAKLGREIAMGLLAAGVMPVAKHVPGHGRAVVDSHIALPRVTEDCLATDILPFRVNADLPWMMTAHIVYRALDPALPATLSATVIEQVIRGRIGYKGVLVTDDLAMKALSMQAATEEMATNQVAAAPVSTGQGLAGKALAGQAAVDQVAVERGTGHPSAEPESAGGAWAYEPAGLAQRALAAGCDIALYCAGDFAATQALLRTCPTLTPAARQRLQAARALLARSRLRLDPEALAAERAGLLRSAGWRDSVGLGDPTGLRDSTGLRNSTGLRE